MRKNLEKRVERVVLLGAVQLADSHTGYIEEK